MKNKQLSLGTAALVAALGGIGAAQAQTSPLYGSVSLGVGRIDGGTALEGLAASGLAGTASQRRSHAMGSLALGYQFTPNFALEAGYQDLGRYRYDAAVTAPGADTVSGAWRASGFNLAAVGTVPLTQSLSAYGKGGVLFAHTQFDGTGSSYAVDQDQHRSVFTLGAGLAYKLTPQVDALLGWDHYRKLGDLQSTGRSDVDTFSVGLKYKF